MSSRGLRLKRRGERFFAPRGGPLGFAEFAGRLAQGWLWLDGWFTSVSPGSTRVAVELAGDEHQLDAHTFRFSRSDLLELPAAGQILVLPLDVGDAPTLGAVHLELGGTWYTWTGSQGMPIRPDLAFRLPEKVAAFSPEIEQAFRDFWDEVCAPWLGGDDVPAEGDMPDDDVPIDGDVPVEDDAPVEVAADPVFELNAAAVDRLIPPPEPEEEEIEEEPEEEIEEEEEEEEELEDEAEEEEEEEPEEEPPACVADAGQPLGLSLEQVVAIDEHRVFLRGWWWDAEDVIEGLDLVSPKPDPEDAPLEADAGSVSLEGEGDETPQEEIPPESEEVPSAGEEVPPAGEEVPLEGEDVPSGGEEVPPAEDEAPLDGEDATPEDEEVPPPREPILDGVIRTARPDVAELYRPNYGDRADDACGFFGLVRLTEPAERHRGYRLELRTAVGEAIQVGKRPPIGEPFAARDVVFRSLPEDQAPNLELLHDHVVPAIEPLQAECRQLAAVGGSFGFGDSPASPETSLLVPVFRRLDLVEHQLVHLAGDAALADCELIYVLDSPELAFELEQNLFHLSRMFEVPVRGLVLERHVGTAGAINAAAAEARGRRLVLLHSDVFPDRSGWIGPMIELADSSDTIGVVGARLLYEDRALQHAGIYFSRRRTADGLWSAVPFFKGLPERFPRAGDVRRVPVVGGACLMIDRALFERAGGLRDVYASADLEDADLCLRCHEMGYESWYLPAATLYHVEGMSRLPGRGWLRNPWTELYNRYLFDRRWDEQIREVMDEIGP